MSIQSKKAQFDTVRTCLCSITSISSSVDELKRGTIHCSTKTAGYCRAWSQRRHLCPVFENRPGLAVSLHPVSCTRTKNTDSEIRMKPRPHASEPGATQTCSITGTATNCSAICGSWREERKVRIRWSSGKIMGTSIPARSQAPTCRGS